MRTWCNAQACHAASKSRPSAFVQPAFGYEVHKGVGLPRVDELVAARSRWFLSLAALPERRAMVDALSAAHRLACGGSSRTHSRRWVRFRAAHHRSGGAARHWAHEHDEAIAVIREAASKLIGANLSVVVNLHSISQVPKYGKDVMIAGAGQVPSTVWYRQMVVDLTRGLLPLGTEKLAISPSTSQRYLPARRRSRRIGRRSWKRRLRRSARYSADHLSRPVFVPVALMALWR